MNCELYARIQKIGRYARLETLSSLCIVVFPIFALGAWSYNRAVSIFCIIMTILSFLTMLYCIRADRCTAASKNLCEFSTSATCMLEIVNAFSGENVDECTYISFLVHKKTSIRLLIQFSPHFSRANFDRQRSKANRYVNHKYQIHAEASSFAVSSSLRVNMVVCESRNDDLNRWIRQDTRNLLSRAESILKVAVVLSEGIVLFPECPFGISLRDLKRYLAGVELIEQQLLLQ